MKKHAYLSASGAHRWLNCPASPSLESSVQEIEPTSVYALEGIYAHNLAELILNGDNEGLAVATKDEMFYEGMLEEVSLYTDYCIEQFNAAKVVDPSGAHMAIESRLNFSEYVPKGFGTGDCTIIANGTMEVIDLKFGKGVLVDVEENPQLMLYGLGALNEFGFLYDIDTVRLTVAQVRLPDGIQSWEISRKDLEEWGLNTVKPIAKLAYDGKGEASAGDWCLWCKYKGQCKTRSDYMLEVVDKHAGKESLTVEDISEILTRSKEIAKWLKDVEEQALSDALSGVKFPGFKIVEGRSTRRITDEEGLAKILIGAKYSEDEVYRPKSIKTLTDLEKLVGKNKFEELAGELIFKPQGAPVLVVESDRRREWNSAEDDFDFD